MNILTLNRTFIKIFLRFFVCLIAFPTPLSAINTAIEHVIGLCSQPFSTGRTGTPDTIVHLKILSVDDATYLRQKLGNTTYQSLNNFVSDPDVFLKLPQIMENILYEHLNNISVFKYNGIIRTREIDKAIDRAGLKKQKYWNPTIESLVFGALTTPLGYRNNAKLYATRDRHQRLDHAFTKLILHNIGELVTTLRDADINYTRDMYSSLRQKLKIYKIQLADPAIARELGLEIAVDVDLLASNEMVEERRAARILSQKHGLQLVAFDTGVITNMKTLEHSPNPDFIFIDPSNHRVIIIEQKNSLVGLNLEYAVRQLTVGLEAMKQKQIKIEDIEVGIATNSIAKNFSNIAGIIHRGRSMVSIDNTPVKVFRFNRSE